MRALLYEEGLSVIEWNEAFFARFDQHGVSWLNPSYLPQ